MACGRQPHGGTTPVAFSHRSREGPAKEIPCNSRGGRDSELLHCLPLERQDVQGLPSYSFWQGWGWVRQLWSRSQTWSLWRTEKQNDGPDRCSAKSAFPRFELNVLSGFRHTHIQRHAALENFIILCTLQGHLHTPMWWGHSPDVAFLFFFLGPGLTM